jgi:hypothetical protein
MKASEILTHPLKQDDPESFRRNFKGLWETIENNCSDALKSYHDAGTMLYRGVNVSKPIKSFLGQNRDQRNVVSGSNPVIGKICDLLMKEAGFKALRGSSIFCGSKYEAARWGRVLYNIFPINGFSFAYSLNHTGCSAGSYRYSDLLYEKIKKYYESDLINAKFPLTKSQLKLVSQQFVDDNQMNQTDLIPALQYGKDVWITGRYIALHSATYNAAFSKKVLG